MPVLTFPLLSKNGLSFFGALGLSFSNCSAASLSASFLLRVSSFSTFSLAFSCSSGVMSAILFSPPKPNLLKIAFIIFLTLSTKFLKKSTIPPTKLPISSVKLNLSNASDTCVNPIFSNINDIPFFNKSNGIPINPFSNPSTDPTNPPSIPPYSSSPFLKPLKISMIAKIKFIPGNLLAKGTSFPSVLINLPIP